MSDSLFDQSTSVGFEVLFLKKCRIHVRSVKQCRISNPISERVSDSIFDRSKSVGFEIQLTKKVSDLRLDPTPFY